jgi:hypothetical protein
MGSLLVVLVILGCVAYQYLKGTLIKSFIVLIISICASVIAFSYFELLAKVLINNNIIASWAHLLSFVLLFILAFAVLQTIAVQLIRQPIDLGLLPERIGRVICGIFLGLIVSGLLLTAIAMAPISPKYPYQRFDQFSPDPENPNKVLLNADGFATGWFSLLSSGSFSGKRSFAVLHPSFLNQLFLNRNEIDNGIPFITSPEAVDIPITAVWPAPEGLKDLDGRPVLPKTGYALMIVRVEITYQAIKMVGIFTPSQVTVVCKQKNGNKNLLAGEGKIIYSVGYLKTANELHMKKLTDRIEIQRSDLNNNGVKPIDFAFYVPDGFVPVLFEFKQNSVDQLPSPVTADQAPAAAPFTTPPQPAAGAAESPATAVEDTNITSESTTAGNAQDTADSNSSQ